MKKAVAKKKLFQQLATLLRENGENLFPDDIADGSPAYQSFEKARVELMEEFDRRGEEKLDD